MFDFKNATQQEINDFISNSTGKELLEFYNAFAEKPTNRFSSIGAGQTRVLKLIEDLRGSSRPTPQPKVKPVPEPKQPKVKPEPKVPAERKSNSAAIAASWQVPEVREARAKRHAVRVTSPGMRSPQEFRSVREAFVALDLPISKHIKFRMALKEAGHLNEFGYAWYVIEA